MPWAALLNFVHSCEEKLKILTKVLVIKYRLDTIMPQRSIRVHETDQPWLNDQLKQLNARLQKAFASGNLTLFKV